MTQTNETKETALQRETRLTGNAELVLASWSFLRALTGNLSQSLFCGHSTDREKAQRRRFTKACRNLPQGMLPAVNYLLEVSHRFHAAGCGVLRTVCGVCSGPRKARQSVHLMEQEIPVQFSLARGNVGAEGELRSSAEG